MNSSDESDLKMRLVKKGWVANSLEGFDIDRAKALLEATRANHDRPPGAIVLSEMRRKELRPVVSSDTGGFFQPNPIMLNALEDELEGQLKKDFAVLKARTLTVYQAARRAVEMACAMIYDAKTKTFRSSPKEYVKFLEAVGLSELKAWRMYASHRIVKEVGPDVLKSMAAGGFSPYNHDHHVFYWSAKARVGELLTVPQTQVVENSNTSTPKSPNGDCETQVPMKSLTSTLAPAVKNARRSQHQKAAAQAAQEQKQAKEDRARKRDEDTKMTPEVAVYSVTDAIIVRLEGFTLAERRNILESASKILIDRGFIPRKKEAL